MKKLSAAKKGTPYCYILQCADGSFYTGWTNDLPRRFREHAARRGGRYTRSRCPVDLVYFERQKDASAARKREAAIKKLPHAKKADLAAGKSRVVKAKGKKKIRRKKRK
ncbi:MAG: GIY-YIG nuclease family protein [Anaerolineales bacterium]